MHHPPSSYAQQQQWKSGECIDAVVEDNTAVAVANDNGELMPARAQSRASSGVQ